MKMLMLSVDLRSALAGAQLLSVSTRMTEWSPVAAAPHAEVPCSHQVEGKPLEPIPVPLSRLRTAELRDLTLNSPPHLAQMHRFAHARPIGDGLFRIKQPSSASAGGSATEGELTG